MAVAKAAWAGFLFLAGLVLPRMLGGSMTLQIWALAIAFVLGVAVVFVSLLSDAAFRGLAGIVNVYPSFPEAQELGPIAGFIRCARRTLDVMVLTGGNLYRQDAALDVALRRKVSLRVLLVDPQSVNYPSLAKHTGRTVAVLQDEFDLAVAGLKRRGIAVRLLPAARFVHGAFIRDRDSAFGETHVDILTTSGRDKWPAIRFRHWHNRALLNALADEFARLWDESAHA